MRRERDLVKAELFSEWDSEFSHTSLHSIIGAIESRVSMNTSILHLGESFGQRVADGEASSAVGHGVGEEYVLQMTLR